LKKRLSREFFNSNDLGLVSIRYVSSEVLDGVLLLLFFPEGEVLLEKLDDGLGISESFLVDIIDLFERVGQSLLTKFASLLVVVHHFVVEHREVESQTQSDWVAGVQTLRRGLGELIVLESSFLDIIELVLLGALGDISVVVSDHFVEEGLGLVGGGHLHALLLNDSHDGHALFVELFLNALLVSRQGTVEFLVFGVLLDGADGPDGSSLGADLVFETNRQQVPLLGGEILALRFDNLLEVVNHIVESLGLLSDSSHKNVFFQV
jgi:hypothetical protein